MKGKKWTQLFTGPLLVQQYLSKARSQLGEAELGKVQEFAEICRQRLFDLSWFMKVLNESIARLTALHGQAVVPVLTRVAMPVALPRYKGHPLTLPWEASYVLDVEPPIV